MGIFDDMLEPKLREEFLQYRAARSERDPRLASMSAYLRSERFESDVKRLQAGEYYLDIPVKKLIPKSYTDRKRVVFHFAEDEMTLLRMMAFALHAYDKSFSPCLYSFKRGIGAKDCLNEMSSLRQLSQMHVIKADIRSYGSSIDPGALVGTLESWIGSTDPELMAFLKWLLLRRVYSFEGQIAHGDETSALPGIPIHNFFTNLYLADVDEHFQERAAWYARYSDDLVVLVESRTEAEEGLAFLLERFEERGLKPHPEKTRILEPGEQFEFLGMSFSKDGVDIAASSTAKLKRRMRIRAKYLNRDPRHFYPSPEAKARRLIALSERNFYGRPGSNDFSWARWTFPVITKTDGLHELDLYLQQCLRYLLTGKWSPARYRASYDELKQLGYQSLVRAYYRYGEDGISSIRKG